MEIGNTLDMHLSPQTVNTYRRLMAKLGATGVTALMRLTVRHALVDAEDGP